MKSFLTILTLLASLHVSAEGVDLNHARNRGGVLLGQTRIDETTDRDVLHLSKCFKTEKIGWFKFKVPTGKNWPVSHLKLFVRKYPVQIDMLKVEYQNGQRQTLNVRDHFKKNTSSRWIDLKGQKRCIKKIIVVGDTDTPRYAPKKRSNLKFYGMK